MYSEFIKFVKSISPSVSCIPLHEPDFSGNEREYVLDTINSTFVSSVGKYVDRFEEQFASYVGSKFAIATVNGTAALHVALVLAGVGRSDEVITQSLTFIATCNAIHYCNAEPIFVDIDNESLGISPRALNNFLQHETTQRNNLCVNKTSGKVIRACVPMHTFGMPSKVDEIKSICDRHNIAMIEDAAESLGSFYKGQHTGTFGLLGAFSFNGNKIITTGGGGMIVTNDEVLAKKAKHITTTAKLSRPWSYCHDEIGFNYRLPNINAALGLAQLEQLNFKLEKKRKLACIYNDFFTAYPDIDFIREYKNARSNYWLNTIILPAKDKRDEFLEITNQNGLMTRSAWNLMSNTDMYKNSQSDDLCNTRSLANRLVNIPSSPGLIRNHVSNACDESFALSN